MKISLILTTYNEATTVSYLLESINTQTRLPDEVVIVDSLSTDATIDIIRGLETKLSYPIRLISHQSNRAVGRNHAIDHAQHPLIAVTDAGCILDKHWLEYITQPLLDNQADSVAGFYLPITPTCFQKSIAPFVAVMLDQLDPATFLPSSRSVAFTKTAWLQAGKYPEHVAYCEDLLFARHLQTTGRLTVQSQAIAYWLLTGNLLNFFIQLSHYAEGDITAGFTPHLINIATIYLRYLIFIFYPFLFLLYLLWPVAKHAHHVQDRRCIFFLPLLQVTADLAIIYGSIKGLSARFSR